MLCAKGFAPGRIAGIQLTWNCEGTLQVLDRNHSGVPEEARKMVLVGSDGVMYPEDGRIAIRKRGANNVRYVDVTDPTPKSVTAKAAGSAADNETYRQYLQFAESLREGKAPLVGPESAKAVVKMVLLAEKSLREHRVMTWNDLPA